MLRDELSGLIQLAQRLVAVDEPAVLATLFSAAGSTYRPLGSMMVSGPGSGFIAGAVSGGCLEGYIARRGRELIDRYTATMLSFETDPDGNSDGLPSLGCGGSIEVLIERCTPDHLSFLHRFSTAHVADIHSSVACVVDPTELPSLSVRRAWLDDEGDSPTDPLLELLRQRSVAEQRSQHGEIGHSRRALIHYVRPLRRLVILGAGNDAIPLCKLGRSLGWHVTVADRRARLANRPRFPEADQVIASDWWSALKQITFTSQTAVVLMTHSIDDDIAILPLLAQKPAAYLGMLGPEHRRGWVLRAIQEAEMLSETFSGGLRGPIGLHLGERSAEGIAISIVAEILAELNGCSAAPLSQFSPTHREPQSKVMVEYG